MFNVDNGALLGMQLANQMAALQSPVAWNSFGGAPACPAVHPTVLPVSPPAPFAGAFSNPTTPERDAAAAAPAATASPVSPSLTPTSPPTGSPGTVDDAEMADDADDAEMVDAPPPAPRAATVNDEGLVLQPPNNSPPRINQAQLANFVLGLNLAGEPENAVKAFNPKIQEFFSHCDCQCANSASRCHLTCDKAHRFMLHQCFREKKKCGGEKTSRGAAGEFDTESHNKVMKHFVDRSQDGSESAPFPKPQDPIGTSVCQQHIAVFHLPHEKEDADGAAKPRWEEIMKMGFDELKQHIKSRHAARKKANHCEKSNNEFTPCAMADRHHEIENEMWVDGEKSQGRRQACTQLKHRHCVNHLKSALLRSESLFRADLSDFFGVKAPKKDTDINQMCVTCNQFARGKTNHGRVLWGGGTRHKDVRVCAVGSAAFHFACRLDVASEFEDMTVEDWMDNKSWFDIELLIDSSAPDNTQPTKNDSFSERVGNVLEKLGLPKNKKLHLGRQMGAKLCDMAESSSEDIRRIGNWNPSICDESHSSKIPIKSIRALAGHDGKVHFNPRTDAEVPKPLLEAMPIGEWCCKAREMLREHDLRGEHATAVALLEFMQEMNEIAAQDAAAMCVLHPTRKLHPMLKDIEALCSDDFTAHVETMRQSLASASAQDPHQATLQKVAPGIQEFHRAHNQDVHSLKEGFGALKIAVETGFQGAEKKVGSVADARDKRLANSFMQAAKVLLRGGELDEEIDELLAVETAVPLNEGVTTGVFEAAPVGAPNLEVAGDIRISSPPEAQTPVDRGGPAPASPAGPPDFSKIRLCPKHHTLRSLCDEWCGRGKCEGRGLKNCNEAHGTKWRKDFKQSEKQLHSKTARIVEAIEKRAEADESTVEDSCAALEELFLKARTGIAKMVACLKETGWIATKKSRGRKTVRESQNA